MMVTLVSLPTHICVTRPQWVKAGTKCCHFADNGFKSCFWSKNVSIKILVINQFIDPYMSINFNVLKWKKNGLTFSVIKSHHCIPQFCFIHKTHCFVSAFLFLCPRTVSFLFLQRIRGFIQYPWVILPYLLLTELTTKLLPVMERQWLHYSLVDLHPGKIRWSVTLDRTNK